MGITLFDVYDAEGFIKCSLQNRFGLEISFFSFSLLANNVRGSTLLNVNYYDYNEQSNGMLSRQNCVTFDFDDSSSILMGYPPSTSSSTLMYFPYKAAIYDC